MDSASAELMRQRFLGLWCRPSLASDAGREDAQRVYADLVKRYAEPHRRYHGWSHLLHCIDQFELAVGLLQDPDAVEMALWFHDSIYVPGAADNERRSAELFRESAAGALRPEFVDKVYRFTMLTRHVAPPVDTDGGFVVDIDLSSLSSDWSRFLEDSDRIRQEQSAIPDAEFYPAQALFLRFLLNRRQIYYSDFFHARCEQAARGNITRFLAWMRERGLLADERGT